MVGFFKRNRSDNSFLNGVENIAVVDVGIVVIPCLLILAFGSGPFEFGSRFYIG